MNPPPCWCHVAGAVFCPRHPIPLAVRIPTTANELTSVMARSFGSSGLWGAFLVPAGLEVEVLGSEYLERTRDGRQ